METNSSQDDAAEGPVSSKGSTQIFLCDASAEGGRLLTALQARGYAIEDVPLGLLPNRIRYEIPRLIVCDADALEAKRLLTETFEGIDTKPSVALIGHPGGAMMKDEELHSLATVTIARPLDVDTALEKVSKLAGAPSRGTHRPRIRLSSRAPLLVAAARKPYRSDGYPSDPPSSVTSQPAPDETLWPVDSPPGRGPAPVDSSRFAFESPGPTRTTSSSSHPPVSDKLSLSPETQAVLEEGQRRVRAYAAQAPRPIRLPALAHTGGDEIREEFLRALAEPLDEQATISAEVHEETSGGRSRTSDFGRTKGSDPASIPPQSAKTQGTFAQSAPPHVPESRPVDPHEGAEDEPTNPGGKPPTHPPPEDPDSQVENPLLRDSNEPPPLDDLSDLLNSKSSHPPTSLPSVSIETERPGLHERFDSASPAQLLATIPPPTRRPTPTPRDFGADRPSILPFPQPAPALPTSLSPLKVKFQDQGPHGTRKAEMSFGEAAAPEEESAMAHLARAIRARQSGAVAQQEGVGLRRIVLTDGDITTVASTLETESLAHFLRSRGDVSDAVLATLGSIPRFGRHAGAALIARGLLQQEDLWPVLRAHAEWIMEHALASDATTIFETSVPARILEEPAVFGGAAGTEIYLETVRRVMSPQAALASFVSEDQVLSWGEYESLLGESALSSFDQAQVVESVGKPVKAALARRADLLPILLGLTYLGVFSTGTALPPRSIRPEPVQKHTSEEIDDEAFAARLRSRRALVDEGDYFSILGIARAATQYEVDRAKDSLLAEYADERLTARNAHLSEDLALVRATIREAHLVLHDDVRRQRYRAALEAVPVAR